MEGLRLRAIHRLRRSRPSGAAHVPSSGTYSHNSAHTPAAVGICEFDVLRANEAPRVPSLAIPRIAFPMACRGSAGVAVLMRAIRGESATRTYCFRQLFLCFCSVPLCLELLHTTPCAQRLASGGACLVLVCEVATATAILCPFSLPAHTHPPTNLPARNTCLCAQVLLPHLHGEREERVGCRR